ncbi:tail protein X [Maridesulfovibrio hydrothermalis]|uniref:Tail protein X n=1 Tax=Maridesulfovibrio hydrothermalis AM13 = DSM 14728 TaxID=1121451 RepID=L0R6B0_9BACT|nr:tail protein X [Maridesulfovibrio hydrothermalis]CCO22234.1 Tail protein X [Maridesulfovibrio hydrothermalis AM13 = DSM 14728]
MIKYLTADKDMLDALCFKFYGREDAVTAVLEANPGLGRKGPVLEAGITIIFPDLPEATTEPDTATVKLWD